MKHKIITEVKRQLSDLITPVNLFLKVRDKYSSALLLESSDYHSKEDSFSFICFDPMYSIKVDGGKIESDLPGLEDISIEKGVVEALEQFHNAFDVDGSYEGKRFNGIFGYSSFESVRYYDTMAFDDSNTHSTIPDIQYSLYRNIIVIDHYANQLMILENRKEGEESQIDAIESIINSQHTATFHFEPKEEESNLSDNEFKELVTLGKKHCQRGDVFQIVFSRQFKQKFEGDEFNAYRSLRSVNPSPYLFYFDYGEFKIFGSSPEAQMVIKNGEAEIHPIAGTYRRTGDAEFDLKEAIRLADDPKESAEHNMLVDLARNDLSKSCDNVHVASHKTIQYFSHVIHLVSKVKGTVQEGVSPFKVFADTFPAGTLSGAPKYKAIELISAYENTDRGFYGGAIGYVSFTGDMNQAIIIRSMLSKNNTLYAQAGAGIVIASDEESELNEVNHKRAAMKEAVNKAANI